MAALNATAACVLGLLELGPPPPTRREPGPDAMTGWQINETAQRSLARFWNITRSQIYLELSRLQDAGLVVSVGDSGPRARRPYRITDAGRGAFREWLEAWAAAGPKDDQLRSPLLLTVFFGEFLDPGVVERLLEEYRLRHQRMLESRRELLKGLSMRERDSLPGSTLDRGIAVHETTVVWLDRTIKRLKSRAQSRRSQRG
ncbi:MAG TPA: helix-turn-helix transcriptional regulator [Actinomycetota bacterium]|jgi:DNA-binding PadR family transcriptional regulator|nr:helix-turn-helix transcriptional regulator [Actinomycetota bacterium]